MSLFRVTKEIEFDAGHRVPLHESKCRNPHGHRYKVAVTVEGSLAEQGSSTAMVVDFGRIKKLLTERVHDRYDHGFIVWEGDDALGAFRTTAKVLGWKLIEVPWHPTAEEMARAIYDDLAPLVSTLSDDAYLCDVQVWETPTSVAWYGA